MAAPRITPDPESKIRRIRHQRTWDGKDEPWEIAASLSHGRSIPAEWARSVYDRNEEQIAYAHGLKITINMNYIFCAILSSQRYNFKNFYRISSCKLPDI